MPNATVTIRSSRADVRRTVRQTVAALAGGPDPGGVARGLQLRLGVALLSKVQQAFIVKSRGGVGEDGIQWQPLKRATIAQRRTSAGERKALGITGKRVRGLLTADEDKRWRRIFATRKSYFMAKFGLSDAAASERAAKIAWATLKAEGAKTKLEVLGNRQVDILRDTGELFRSLSPGVDATPSGADGQIFETPPGQVIVGTNKKPWHHTGIPGKLPARPLWPTDGRLPVAWWDALLRVIQMGALRALELALREQHR